MSTYFSLYLSYKAIICVSLSLSLSVVFVQCVIGGCVISALFLLMLSPIHNDSRGCSKLFKASQHSQIHVYVLHTLLHVVDVILINFRVLLSTGRQFVCCILPHSIHSTLFAPYADWVCLPRSQMTLYIYFSLFHSTQKESKPSPPIHPFTIRRFALNRERERERERDREKESERESERKGERKKERYTNLSDISHTPRAIRKVP